MQSEQFTHNIRRKRVMSTDGKIIGQIKNISFDAKTGLLMQLVVRPDPAFDTTGFRVENEAITIPFDAVKDITDFIVVDRYMLH
ncbi:PRC-barrel domain-containing protein [Methanocorpusculum sp.]|nr:PRC-barrel domain-containing protein [Methanocorpusculum sp.]MBO5368633.1 PRC-barrel domain-containing protein [Methanocorpusculum sp.]MBP3444141.1 PRC-barrel domain-containing protein [Methanocorpusculaceae archaeon]MBQ4598269.1 PRC-barrel domain-containing protein [Methanocorpusculum sp.]